MAVIDRTTRDLLRALSPYLLRYRRRATLAALVMAVGVVLQLPLPLLTMYVIDKLVTPEKSGLVTLLCLGLIGLLIVRTVSSVLERYFLHLFRLRVVCDLKVLLYEHLLRLSLDYFHKKQTGYLISRVSGDIDGIQGLFAETFLIILRNILTFMVGLVMVYWLNVKLAILATLLLPLYLVSLLAFNGKVQRLVTENREAYANVFRFLQEHISGVSVLKALGAEKHDTIGMLRMLKQAVRKEFASAMTGTIASTAANFISSLGPILLLWVGIIEITHGRLTIGGLIAFNSFLIYLFSPLSALSGINVTIQSSLACARRTFELLDLPPEKTSPGNRRTGSTLRVKDGGITFENVHLSYNHDAGEALRGVSFDIPPGCTTALVGRSGSGKSSLVNLLFRFYDYQAGCIAIDGHEVRDYDIHYLRSAIGLVSQETFLFGGSIRDNIRLGKLRASDDEVVAAAKAAYADEFILRLPEQYDTKLGERGALISGGERQRIALARAFLKNPKILILDEATSSLDSTSEHIIQAAMQQLFIGRTVLVISHRLASVCGADHIVVLEAGQVVGSGSHPVLYETTPAYRTLYDQQRATDSKEIARSHHI